MRIAIIGAGAMGSIYGGHLSLKNEVYLIDNNPAVCEAINKSGLIIDENNTTNIYKPVAKINADDLQPVDLIILFVKALYSKSALESNKNIIGANTYLMTLQNGSGHEDILKNFVGLNKIIIGTTEDNGAVLYPGHVRHGGNGNTNIGMLVNDENNFMLELKNNFDSCGFNTKIHDNIQQLIWNKLFTNISLSVVTGVLKCKMGFIAQNNFAWNLAESLLFEAVNVAHALGIEADFEKLREEIKTTSKNNPEGVTSICADLKAGRKTEVDTISGSVVRAANKLNIKVPCNEFIINLVHALESENSNLK